MSCLQVVSNIDTPNDTNHNFQYSSSLIYLFIFLILLIFLDKILGY